MEYIKQYYDLPFLSKGMKVEADGKSGKINKEKNGYLEILFDNGIKALAHPTWEIVYYNEKGEIIKDFRKPKHKIERQKRILEKNKFDELINMASGKANVEITPNLRLKHIVENNWDDDNNLIAVSCDFIVFNEPIMAYIIVDDLQLDKPRYGEIESEDLIHDTAKSLLNSIDIWEKLVPVLKYYKEKWEEIQKLPF
ncbi:hypothetical protein [Chryseobacterium oncorhynchi]|uniref:DUF402 domain-containing protein n=1 Tax=Chryseobacterium oncorhynchi TaxID=741074 RepID=A0A316X2U3_9FLAO|nr:hypothetical protein [Chryseobacterium oncorhynchi]PWN67619.1 hypothetical protein C1638_003240 [Chryseobacterium oncorhynchi]